MRLVEKLRRIAAPAAVIRPAGGGSRGAPLPGERVDGELGPIWLRRLRIPLDREHGCRTLAAVREAPLQRLAEVARDPLLARADEPRAIYFDTETTSLGGGVSTYVFLLGAGYFDADAFVVEQYFLHQVPDERALLHTINSRFQEFDVAVSFYGKGFDAPRLNGRLAFHRMQLELPPSHLDLCLVGRSLYRGAFADCRLQTFERELVRFSRADDLPGADCPRAFFSHLQGDSSLIPRVFEHNLYDVLTLPAIAASFVGEVEQPGHPVVLSNLGSFYETAGRDRDARASYAAAIDGLRAEGHPMLPRTLERLALLERRAGRHAESAALLIERRGIPPHAIQPLEDLAKYYEHRVRDLDRAEEAVLDARSRLVTGKIQVDRAARERHLKSLDHRLGRLRRRRGRLVP